MASEQDIKKNIFLRNQEFEPNKNSAKKNKEIVKKWMTYQQYLKKSTKFSNKTINYPQNSTNTQQWTVFDKNA